MTLFEHLRELRYRLVVASPGHHRGDGAQRVLLQPALRAAAPPVRPRHRRPEGEQPGRGDRPGQHRARLALHAGPQDLRGRGRRAHRADLALPAVGVRRAGPAGQGAEVGADLHRHRHPAVPPRRRHRVLRAAQGDRGAARLHPAGRVQPAGHQHLPVLHAPADDRLRRRLPDPAAGADAQHRRRGQSKPAVEVPHPGDLRHLRLRCRRHPVHRPVLDAGARSADESALPGRRGDRPHPGPAQEPTGRDATRSSTAWPATAPCGSSPIRTSPTGEPADPAGRQSVVGQGPGHGAAARRGRHPARRRRRCAGSAQPGVPTRRGRWRRPR